MRNILTLAIAGAAGTLGRWALNNAAIRLLGERFPYGTLLVNVLGCLIAGFAMQMIAAGDVFPSGWRLPLTVGFLGAFTTFSAFGYQTVRLMQTGEWAAAMANVGANLVLGFGAVWLGFIAAKAAFSGS